MSDAESGSGGDAGAFAAALLELDRELDWALDSEAGALWWMPASDAPQTD